MSAYLSSFLNTTTTKYNSIRRALISSDTDGDTEDESHISRALRNYYTEKGRQFPDWLPPDPNAPPVPQPVSFNAAAGGPGGAGGFQNQQQSQQSQRWGRGGGGLSDLWGDQGGQQQQQPMQPQSDSLRPSRFGQSPSPHRGGGMAAAAGAGGGAGGGRFGDLYGDQGRPQSGGRIGSYQSSRLQDNASPAPSASSGNTAKDMLKQKLWGNNRTTSPTPAGSYGGGAGAGGNPYDAPSGRPQYGGQSSYGGNDSYGGGGGGRQTQGSSWGGSDAQAPAPARGYGSNPYGNNPASGKMGLPSGPRPRRG